MPSFGRIFEVILVMEPFEYNGEVLYWSKESYRFSVVFTETTGSDVTKQVRMFNIGHKKFDA